MFSLRHDHRARTMMSTARIALTAFLLLSHSSLAAEKTLTWTDDCRNTIKFNPAKYDEKSLTNTVKLLFGNPPPFEINPSVHPPPIEKPEDVAKLDLAGYEKACAELVGQLSDRTFIALPGIEELQSVVLDQTRDACRFGAVLIRAHKDPAALREYEPAAACSPFADALEGKTDIVRVWRQTVQTQCKNSSEPAKCVRTEFANERKSNAMAWIRLYVLHFGWNNCAIDYIKINTLDAKATRMRNDLEKRFKRLFTIKKDRCQH
jgi:hypothetical protein